MEHRGGVREGDPLGRATVHQLRKALVALPQVRHAGVPVVQQRHQADPGLNHAASRIDQRWMIHPIQINEGAGEHEHDRALERPPLDELPQSRDEELASAAMTFPDDPCPAMPISW